MHISEDTSIFVSPRCKGRLALLILIWFAPLVYIRSVHFSSGVYVCATRPDILIGLIESVRL